MYQASLYLKTNLRVCLFTTSKGIKIGPSCPELRGVSKVPLAMKHPVDKKYAGAEVQIEYTLIGLFHKQTSDKNKNTRRKSPFESSSITDILDNDVINTNPRVGNIEPD